MQYFRGFSPLVALKNHTRVDRPSSSIPFCPLLNTRAVPIAVQHLILSPFPFSCIPLGTQRPAMQGPSDDHRGMMMQRIPLYRTASGQSMEDGRPYSSANSSSVGYGGGQPEQHAYAPSYAMPYPSAGGGGAVSGGNHRAAAAVWNGNSSTHSPRTMRSASLEPSQYQPARTNGYHAPVRGSCDGGSMSVSSAPLGLSLIHIAEPTRRRGIAVGGGGV